MWPAANPVFAFFLLSICLNVVRLNRFNLYRLLAAPCDLVLQKRREAGKLGKVSAVMC